MPIIGAMSAASRRPAELARESVDRSGTVFAFDAPSVSSLTNLSLRWKLICSFGLVLGCLIGLVTIAYRTTSANQTASEQVAHSLRVISGANVALVSLIDQETGYRGFLITGLEDFLEPYTSGQQALAAELSTLIVETADNPDQVARWRELASRAETWRNVVAEPGIALRRTAPAGVADFTAISEYVGAVEGKRQTDAMRVIFAEALQAEQALLTAHRRQATVASAQLQQALVAGSVLAVALGVLLALLLARQMVDPMARLANTAGQIAAGALDRRIGLKRRDEIGQAAAAFDRMADRLQATIQRSETILSTAAEGILGLDRVGRVIFANPSAVYLTGFSRTELIGNSAHDLVHHSRSDGSSYPRESCPVHQGLGDGSTVHVTDEVYWRRDGSSFPVEYTSAPIVERGATVGAVLTFRDVTARRQAEQELRDRAEDLARSNAELEQFAYVASHDLQEPLRAIVSYLQLFERRYRGQLDERSDRYIGHAVDGARRMQTLINDLLVYSRVGRRGADFSRVDTERVLSRVLANLRAALDESAAEVSHDPLPKVIADPSQLGQLLQNLVGNAVKFRGERPPRVHLSAERDGDAWRFAVRDNGIGIESAYLDRIFVLFQRLHGRAEYPGTGIGLAICKKIVERHGGQIWVESEPGQGSTFYFTIPEIGDNAP
jgi:PAS domain S-box-containing protein